MKYSFYETRFSKTCRQVSVAELIEIISKKEIRELCAKIEAAVLAGADDEAKQLKEQLPGVCLSELYKQGAPRLGGTGEPTGLVMIDYDNCKSMEELNELQNKLKKLAISHPVLKELIVAAHTSQRWHGVHVWLRWIEGCKSVEECQAKFAEMAELPDYDKECIGLSRFNGLVHKDMFFISNWGAMERNEKYAKIQAELTKESKKNGRRIKHYAAGGTASVPGSGRTGGADSGTDPDGLPEQRLTEDKMYGDLRLKDIFKELTRLCAPAGLLDEEGNVMEGARDNTLLRLCNLFRYVVDNNPERVLAYMPQWALDLDLEHPGTCEDKAYRMCERNMSPIMPPTLRQALKNLHEEGAEKQITKEELNQKYNEELAKIEENQRFFFEVPQELPPVFAEYVKAFPFAWKPAAILALLPVLGTLMSRVRSQYLDLKNHSLSFQTVIEAGFGKGKSIVTDVAGLCLTPLTDADFIGNHKLNAYNALSERVKTGTLPEKPDVCTRKIVGDFTVAGFEETLGTSKGLHMWCQTSEIDVVRKAWGSVSYILRKAFDNDYYGRNLQSSKTFRGERRVYFNTLLCGTSERIDAVYRDPEDGLVSRTMFFRLLLDNGKMPVVRMDERTKKNLAQFLQKIHDKYSLNQDGVPVDEQMFTLPYINKTMERWLDEKYDESVRTGNFAMDAFRRRDAVIGFRAGVLAHVLMLEKYGKTLTIKQKKMIQKFATWVAEYSLQSHLAKFGSNLKTSDTSNYGADTRKKDILSQLPDAFTLADAYDCMKYMAKNNTRAVLSRLVSAGYLKREDRGMYIKTKKG